MKANSQKYQSVNARSLWAVALMTISFLLLPLSISAQPQKSRVGTNNARTARQQQQQQQQVSRASLMYPTAVAVPEDVPWRRDVYRELDLTKDENAALYYPVEARGNEMNLFTLLFRLLNTGKIPAYEYKLDGKEDFTQANRMHFKDMLERYKVLYEVDGNKIIVNDADVPSAEVLGYYVKESTYYDEQTATFHSRVVAICPIIHRSIDDFSFDLRKFPMFWVKIEDIEPYLSQRMIMISNLNNASRMSMADFFATNKYKGTIYMTTNMQGKSLQQEVAARQQAEAEKAAGVVDSLAMRETLALQREQNRIEKQLVDFEKHIWETPVDSAELARKDSIAAAEAAAKAAKKNRRVSRAAKSGDAEADSASSSRSARRSTADTKKEKKEKSSSSSGSASRVSVRRQRH